MVADRGLRIALFGSGSPMSVAVARGLESCGGATLLVLPKSAARRNPLAALAAEKGISVTTTGQSDELAGEIRGREIDLLCCATFPEKIDQKVLEACRRGGINIHPSLLPVHRGPDPIFWTYVHDDRSTGITIHEMTSEIDAGDILYQTAVPLARAKSAIALYQEMSAIAAEKIADIAMKVVAGTAERRRQDEALATYEPSPVMQPFELPFHEWSSERVWHVLGGLGEIYHDLIRDSNGQIVLHGRASSWETTAETAAGTIEVTECELILHCRDGIVRTERHHSPRRARRFIAAILTRFSSPADTASESQGH